LQYIVLSSDLHCIVVPNIPKIPEPNIPPLPALLGVLLLFCLVLIFARMMIVYSIAG
jgi:hypothetical protein